MSYFSSKLLRCLGPPKLSALKLITIAGVLLFTWLLLPGQSFAVRNNKTGVRELTLRSLRSASQNVDSTYVNNIGRNSTVGPYCNAKKKLWHFQDAWLSLKDNPKGVDVTIDENDNSVGLQFNIIGGTCHKIFTTASPSQSKILDPATLEITSTNITGSSASVVGEKNLGITWDARDPGWARSMPDMNYKNAYDNSLRFVKENETTPYNRGLTVTGLGTLKPGTYTILINVEEIMVNRFGSNTFKCVNGGGDTNNLDSSNNSCPKSDRPLKINLTVKPQYAAECEITAFDGVSVANGRRVNIVPGQDFTASFRVKNIGTKAWDLTEADPVRLGTVDDTSKWGSKSPSPNRANIKGVEFGGGALGSGTTTVFTRDFKASNPLPAGDFAWRVQKRDNPKITDMGQCSYPINSVVNRPFLRASGSDVVSGATFLNNADQYSSARSVDASIITNGFDEARGSSSGQYGVFASGFINSLGKFYSNNFNKTENRNDLTFSNTGLEGADSAEYGKFYGSAPLPNVNISSLVDIAKASGAVDPTNSELRKHVSNSENTLDPADSGGSAYLEKNNDGYSIGLNSSGQVVKSFDNVQGSKVIVVEGDVTIAQNLEYGDSKTNMIFVVIGNIYIRSNVDRLDGTYIAFPTDDSNGIFDTCYDAGDKGVWPDNLTIDSCNKQLTVNGRLIASKVLWKRTWGTVGKNSDVLVKNCVAGEGPTIAKTEQCAAEFIDFSPEAYFNSPISSSDSRKVENVPSSSIELPPIY